MAFVPGRSLARALEDGPPFTPHRAAFLVRKLALAMQAAHALGVVHRDLKPANVLLRPDGEPVVMDFGLARRGDDQQSAGMTRQGDLIGTLEYMSPEQLDGDNAAVGPPADIYALGVILYELLTGRRPFTGNTARILVAIMLKPPPRPGELRPGLPERLEEICLTAMAKRPEDRFPTMAGFAAALTEFLRSHPPGGSPAAARSAEAAPTPPPSAPTRPVRERAEPAPPAAGEDPGWELVEDPPPAAPAPPKRVVRGRLVKRRKKAKAGGNRPVVLGGIAAAVTCLILIVAAVALWPRDNPRPAAPASPPAPAERGTAKPPPGEKSAGEPAPSTTSPSPGKRRGSPRGGSAGESAPGSPKSPKK
jgi:serine/threonine-protein kinase